MICFISSRQITMSWHIGCTVISQINGICGPVEKMEFKLNLKYRSLHKIFHKLQGSIKWHGNTNLILECTVSL